MQKAIALRQQQRPLLVIDVEDALFTGPPQPIGSMTYEDFLAAAIRSSPGSCRPTSGTPSR
jgi:fatty-acyl-CoA synthase